MFEITRNGVIAGATGVAAILAVAVTPALTDGQAQATDIPPVRDGSGALVEGGFASLEKITLGGVEQWVLIRTQDISNPVLLILHGGPGGSQMPWVDLFQPASLEANFTVVHWDQRGAGKSFDPDLSAEDLQLDRFIADTLELSEMLRGRFEQDKIFLTGHSWGSALGFLTLARDSEPYHAFIATGERVHWIRSHEESFAWVTAQAERAGNEEVLAMIADVDRFDATDPAHLDFVYAGQELFRGGDIYTEGLWDEYLDYAISGQSPYYTEDDVMNYIPGTEKSSAALMDAVPGYDLFTTFPASDIPVHFIMGEHDHNTSARLAREYFDVLEAPAKSFTLIEDAGHSFIYEKPEAWADALIAIKDQTLQD